MAIKWQNYLRNRLDYLMEPVGDVWAPKKAFRFMNLHRRALGMDSDVEQLVVGPHQANPNDQKNLIREEIRAHPSDFIKYAPRIVSKIPEKALFDWVDQDDGAFDAIVGHRRFRRKVEKFISNSDSILDQRQCRKITKKNILWNRLNPENRWWTIFKFLPFVKRIINNLKAELYAKSPLFKEKLEGVSLFEIANDDMEYFNGFLNLGNDESNNYLLRKLTKHLSQEQLKEIISSEQWDDRVKAYIENNNLLIDASFDSELSLTSYEDDEEERKQVEEEVRKRLEEEELKRLEEEERKRLEEEERKRLEEEERKRLEEEERKRLEEEERKRLEEEERKRLEEEERKLIEEEVRKRLEEEEQKRLEEEAHKRLEEEAKLLQEKINGKMEVDEAPQKEEKFYNYDEHPPVQEFIWDKSKDYLATHAKNTSFARNANPHDQFKCDIDMTRAMFDSPGSGEGQLAARIKKKLLFVLAHTNPMYKRNGQWYYFSEPHEVGKYVPISSINSHTVRTTIELPTIGKDDRDLGREFFHDFLWEGNPLRRHAATHGAIVRPKPEMTRDGILKNVDEIKPGKIEAGINAATEFVVEKLGYEKSEEGHYGASMGLGGEGKAHPLSQRIINDKGENGAIYNYYKPATKKEPGVVVNADEGSQSGDRAHDDVVYFPGSVYDNWGGGHDVLGTPNYFSPTGGDHFAKPPKFHKDNKDYEGIQNYGPDQYYNSIYLRLNREQIIWLMDNYSEEAFEKVRIDRPPTATIATLGNYEEEQTDIEITEKSATNWGRFFGLGSTKSVSENMDELIHEFQIIDPSDEKSIQHVITQAKIALKKYLDKVGIRDEDKEKMEYFIRELSELRNVAHLTEIVNEMEIVNINIGADTFASIRELVVEQGGQCLSQEVKKELQLDEADEGCVHGTMLDGGSIRNFWNIFYTGSDLHFKDQLIQAHQILMPLLPKSAQVFEKNDSGFEQGSKV